MTMSSSKSLSTSFSDFAIKLYRSASEQKSNVLISPFSISTAFTMVLAGARGNTAEEMKKVLSIDSIEDTLAAFPGLISHLNSGNFSNKIKIANKIFLDEGLPIIEDFTHLMTKAFQTEYGKVSFSNQKLAAKDAINAWVSANTNGKIKDLINDDIDPMTRMIIISAIYFKGLWAEQFSKDSTQIASFHLNSNQSIAVEMMYQKKKFGYVYDSELKAKILSLPYEQNAVSLVVILPDEIEGLHSIEQKLDSNKLNKILYDVKKHQSKLHVYFPKFKAEESLDLKGLLSAMGMVDAFSPRKADFSGIVKENILYIGSAIHKAYIEVNEEGTEAAAATEVRLMKRSLEILDDFNANHPFIYFIVENSQNLVLFVGALKTPNSAEKKTHEEL